MIDCILYPSNKIPLVKQRHSHAILDWTGKMIHYDIALNLILPCKRNANAAELLASLPGKPPTISPQPLPPPPTQTHPRRWGVVYG